MSNKASERLIRLNGKIMQTWEARAIEEVAAAVENNSLALRNSLPEFLGQIAAALNTSTDRSTIRTRWEKSESTRVGKKHGRERANEVDYTIDQLIFEYHILRQVICDLMEEEEPLSVVEREVIVCAVEQAVNDAATEFSQTLNDIQETFTQALAHDLRGPVTSSKLGAELLLKKPHDADHSIKIATRINASMDRLDLMIRDLLDASQLGSGGKMHLDLEHCDLDQILLAVADETNFLHGKRVIWKSIGPVKGRWNESGLRRVIDNLVGNALKFSPPGSPITIEVSKDPQIVCFTVHNSGTPIPTDEKKMLFQKFRKARRPDTKQGWGLGLSVVKGVVEGLGGEVQVDSSEQGGTIFTVKLPIVLDQ